MTALESYLPFLLPPLLGALIGYVTNYVAIRMLFRPLRPWRVLGLRLPLTPGIIPSKRYELAEKMGEMVGTHLLTSDDVGRVLAREGFRRELRLAVSEKLGGFLDRDLGPAAELVPAAYRDRFGELLKVARWKALNGLFDYLGSDDFEVRLRSFLRRRGDELLARDLESFLTPRRYECLQGHLEERIGTLLRSEELAAAAGRFVDDRVERLLQSDRPLRELLPADLQEIVLARLNEEVPPLLEKFGGLMYDHDFRERLAVRAKDAIEGFLDSLEGFSGLFSGFINLDKLYAKLPEFMDKAGDEIARLLREKKTQEKVSALLRERVEAMLERSPGSYLESVPYEKVAGVRRFVRSRAVETLQSSRTAEASLRLAESGIERIKDQPFGALLDQVLPEGGRDRLQESLAERLLETLRSPEVRKAFEEILEKKSEELIFRRKLGKLSARLPADVREELEAGLCQQLAELLKKEVPPLVETLNVRLMVEEKVNTLDILQVEGLLLGIMKEQFKYINLFGGLLGFLIGLANLLVFYLR